MKNKHRAAILMLALLPPAAAVLDAVTDRQTSASARPGWPGLWGPSRNGTATVAAAAAPRIGDAIWRRPTDGGYSEIAVQGATAYTMERRGDQDFVIALDAASGRDVWRVLVGPTYRGHGGSDDGPISTPAVAGGDVFALGPHGHLLAMDSASGKERWRHDLVKEAGAAAPTWGFAASPLVEGELVIVPTGGPNSKGLVAFERSTGRVVWNAPIAKTASYASAVAATVGGVRQVIAASGDRIFAVSPRDGRELWSVAGPGGDVEVANSPLLAGSDRVLLTFWEQSVMLKISSSDGKLSATEVWRSPRLRSSNGPTIARDGFLYGFAGPQLLCMDADDAEVRWRERTDAGTLIAIGAHLFVLSQESGDMRVAPASPEAYKESQRARLLQPGTRAVTGPSYADGRLFVRNLKEIAAFAVK